MSWKIDGIETVNGVYNGSTRRHENATDLFDSTSRLEYQPNENNRNITCLVNNSDGSFTENKVHIKGRLLFINTLVFQLIKYSYIITALKISATNR